jgi:hypothetical protein
VVYSGRVREEIMSLIARAKEAGVGPQAFAAVKHIDRVLRIYPQFGEPVRDAATPGRTEWVATVAPLLVHYVIDEPNRTVYVVRPIKPMNRSGF